MKCKVCGKVLAGNDLRFCSECGAKFRDPETGEVFSENFENDEKISLKKDETAETTLDSMMAAAEKIAADAEAMAQTENDEISEEEILPAGERETPQPESAEETPEGAPIDVVPVIEPETLAAEPVTDLDAEENEPDESPEKPPKSIKIGGKQVTGAALISFVATLVMVLICTAVSVRLSITADGLRKSVANMNVWTVLNAEVKGLSISDRIYNSTDFGSASHGNASRQEFLVFLAETDFMQFAADKVGIYADYILNGSGESPTVTENEIVDFFSDYTNVGYDVFDYRMQMADYNAIRKSLTNKNVSEELSVSKIGWDIHFRLENIRYIISYVTIGIFGMFWLVLLIWLAMVVNVRARYLLSFYGGTFLWGGLVVLFSGIAAAEGAAIGYVLTGNFVLYICASCLLPTSVYMICIGAVSTIIGYVLKKLAKHLRIKQKKTAEA